MAVIHIHHGHHLKAAPHDYQRTDSSYAAMWLLVALAVVAAVIYGYYSGQQLTQGMVAVDEAGVTQPLTISPQAL